MTPQGIIELVATTLAGGCGLVIQWLFSAYADAQAQRGVEIAPFWKRWIMIGLTIVVPTTLYLMYVIATYNQADPTTYYSWLQNIAYIGTAFAASQGAHSAKLAKVAPDSDAPSYTAKV